MKICPACRRCYEDTVLSCTEENHDALIAARPGSREITADYRLDFLLECDAVSEAYAATNIKLNQSCVVTTLDANLADTAQLLREQFQNEARNAAAVEHPNVVRVFESGVLDSNEFYVVTESAEGRTLREYSDSAGSLSEKNAVMIARQTAEGLEAAHAAGVHHRNLNLTNIILTPKSKNGFLVKIQNFDFGNVRQAVASAIPDSEPHLNWLRYSSPEQCAAQTTDARADIYSLGIVLYEMLAGRPPFDAPDAVELISKQISEPPPPAKISNFDIRALLTHTLMQALQKSPARRLQSANAFARQLRHIEQLITRAPIPVPASERISAPTATSSGARVIQSNAFAAKSVDSLLEKIQPSAEKTGETVTAVSTEAEQTGLLKETVREVRTVEVVSPAQPEPIFVKQKTADNYQLAPETGLAQSKLTEGDSSEPETIQAEGNEFDYADFEGDSFPLIDASINNPSEPVPVMPLASSIEQTPTHQPPKPNSLLSYDTDSESRQPMMSSRPILAGAGLALLVSAIIGVALNEKFQPSAAPQPPVAAPVTESAPLPKPEELTLTADENTAAAEESKTGETDGSDLGKYTPLKFEKAAPTAPFRDGKSLSPKEKAAAISKDKVATITKAEQNPPPDKKLAPEGNVSKIKAKQNPSLNNKIALKKQIPVPTEEPDIFNRPRKVKEGSTRRKN